jgi:hypothetical protein
MQLFFSFLIFSLFCFSLPCSSLSPLKSHSEGFCQGDGTLCYCSCGCCLEPLGNNFDCQEYLFGGYAPQPGGCDQSADPIRQCSHLCLVEQAGFRVNCNDTYMFGQCGDFGPISTASSLNKQDLLNNIQYSPAIVNENYLKEINERIDSPLASLPVEWSESAASDESESLANAFTCYCGCCSGSVDPATGACTGGVTANGLASRNTAKCNGQIPHDIPYCNTNCFQQYNSECDETNVQGNCSGFPG